MDNVHIIIQARLGSSRLPGKALLRIGNYYSIEWVLKRSLQSKLAHKVIFATGIDPINDALIDVVKQYNIPIFRGDNDYLLNRYYECAKEFGSQIIVRITGDCPCVDPDIIDKVISLFLESGADYASNVHPPTFPDGFDVEVFSFLALEKAYKQAKIDSDRENPTTYFWKKKGLFKLANLTNKEDINDMRIVLDYQEDLDILQKLHSYVNFENATLDEITNAYKKLNLGFYPERNIAYTWSVQKDGDSYKKSLSKSDELINKSINVIPNASQTYSKSYRHFAYPLFLSHGYQGHVWDVDGNEYADFNCGLGAISLGYNYKDFNQICYEQMIKGASFSQPTSVEVNLAQKLVDIIPSAKMVKFLKNGSDVTSAAVRLARAYTGKDIIVRCGYHGFQDWYIGSTSNNLGVPQAVRELTVSFEYNNINSLKSVLKSYKVAAVIMEPFQFNGPDDNFLTEVRNLCNENDVILIFDEVLSGFRNHIGGVQSDYNVIPDLSVFGKAVANGMPLSILVGAKDIMKIIDDGVFISTTFGGEAVSLVAALYTINELENNDGCNIMYRLGIMWKQNVQDLLDKYKINGIKIVGHPAHCGLVFDSTDVLSFYQQSMAEQGILTLGINNFCLSHTEKDVMNFVNAVDFALNIISKKSSLPFCRDYKIKPVFIR